MHLFGFIIRIYHDARSSECQNTFFEQYINFPSNYLLSDWCDFELQSSEF